MRKWIATILSVFVCLGAVFSAACNINLGGGTGSSTASEESSSVTVEEDSFVSIVDFQEGKSGIWFYRYNLPANDENRLTYGTYMQETVAASNGEKRANLRFVMDTLNNDYTKEECATLVKIKPSLTKEELEGYATKGYKYLSVSLLVETSFSSLVMGYYPVFDTVDGVRKQTNNGIQKFYLNQWVEMKLPISWLINDYEGVQEKYLLFFSYSSIFSIEDVYTIYFGDIGLK